MSIRIIRSILVKIINNNNNNLNRLNDNLYLDIMLLLANVVEQIDKQSFKRNY